MIKTLIHYCSSLVNHTRFQTKIGSLYPFSDQNAAKTQTFSKSVPVSGASVPARLWRSRSRLVESLQKTLPFGSAQLGGIFLYVLYKGVPSPPGGVGGHV